MAKTKTASSNWLVSLFLVYGTIFVVCIMGILLNYDAGFMLGANLTVMIAAATCMASVTSGLLFHLNKGGRHPVLIATLPLIVLCIGLTELKPANRLHTSFYHQGQAISSLTKNILKTEPAAQFEIVQASIAGRTASNELACDELKANELLLNDLVSLCKSEFASKGLAQEIRQSTIARVALTKLGSAAEIRRTNEY